MFHVHDSAMHVYTIMHLCQTHEHIPLIKQSTTLTQDPRAKGDLSLI